MKGSSNTSPVSANTPTPEMGGSLTYDPEFKGPLKNRSCTDVICLFLFVSFLAGWAVISVFAFRFGNPNLLIYPTDSGGQICGMYNMSDKPFLYFFDLTKCANPSVIFKGCPTPQVCVKQCPNETFYASTATATKDQLICVPKADMTKSIEDLVKSDMCAGLYLKSKPLVGRCIPEIFTQKGGDDAVLDKKNVTVKNKDGQPVTVSTIKKASRILAKFLNTKNIGEKIFSDIKVSWHLILIALIMVMILSFLWIFLMRWFAGVMVWASIFAVTGLFAYALYYSVMKYIELQAHPEASGNLEFTTNLQSYFAMKDTWLVFAIASGLILLVMLLILCFLRKRMLIAIALIKEASKAVSCMMSTLVLPIIPYALQLTFFCYWAAVALYIASSGKATFVVHEMAPKSTENAMNVTECKPWEFNSTNAACRFKDYGASQHLYEAQLYSLFAMLWGVFFAIGVGEVTLAGAFATYYWTRNKPRDIPSCAIFVGFWRCLRYHLGSVAFGSLLIATVRFIRIMLEYIDKKCKKYDNAVTRAIMCCLKCCFWCLEKFIRFISKNAYIMVAIYGKNFCVSAKHAFELLLRNAIRVVVLDKVTDFLLLLGKLAIVGAAAVGSFYIFTGRFSYVNQYIPFLNYRLVPIIIITVGAYIISSLFFNVYGMAVDTLFLCFLEDLERNDGSPQKPYYMSKELIKILGKKNKFRDPKHHVGAET